MTLTLANHALNTIRRVVKRGIHGGTDKIFMVTVLLSVLRKSDNLRSISNTFSLFVDWVLFKSKITSLGVVLNRL